VSDWIDERSGLEPAAAGGGGGGRQQSIRSATAAALRLTSSPALYASGSAPTRSAFTPRLTMRGLVERIAWWASNSSRAYGKKPS
jgi:hypothetical protein